MMKGFAWGAVLVMGAGMGACTTDDAESTADTAQLLSGHRNLPNGVPIPNATGLTAPVRPPGSLDLTPQAEREWLEATLAGPAADAADAALEVLVRSLAAAVDSAPPRQLASLGEKPAWRAPGA